MKLYFQNKVVKMEYRVVDGLKEELRIKRQKYYLKYVSCIFQ